MDSDRPVLVLDAGGLIAVERGASVVVTSDPDDLQRLDRQVYLWTP